MPENDNIWAKNRPLQLLLQGPGEVTATLEDEDQVEQIQDDVQVGEALLKKQKLNLDKNTPTSRV